MIIRNIIIENFGIFKGKNEINLEPSLSEGKNIIVISGKNGVGKSTILEAIHLCLLGSLALDSRISEASYETHLLLRSFRNSTKESQQTSLHVQFEFTKSGQPIQYTVIRQWSNVETEVNEEIIIFENEKELIELSKKEKNLFLRELIQPGFSRIMFFDGEQLSRLFESSNLSAFIQESCNNLFGLNFIELLKTDLNYFTNKLVSQQGSTKNSDDLKKAEDEISKIGELLAGYFGEKELLEDQLLNSKNLIVAKEEEINKQGRWLTKKLDKIKIDKQKIENAIITNKKEIVELYGGLGPFAFCKQLCLNVRDRLTTEREVEKWHHARELLNQKATEIEAVLKNSSFLKDLSITSKAASKLFSTLKNTLLSKPAASLGDEVIHHNISDTERSKLINWIDSVTGIISHELKSKTETITANEDKLKLLIKEQGTFSKDDIIQPLVKELQEINKQIGATEQKIASTLKKINEQLGRKEYYNNILNSIQEKIALTQDINGKLQLSYKTKLALEDYSKELLTKKISLLEKSILKKFNFLCRKENYFDDVSINVDDFHVTLKINAITTEHKQLSAGEKQLFILALLWALRDLTNIKLPLIIDTPIARLDYDHRMAFICDFLPAIHPQVILIGTDTEIMDELLEPVMDKVAYHYHFEYDRKKQSSKIQLKSDSLILKTA